MTVAHTEEGERTVSQSPTGNRAAATERAILAGGCFWGMEDLLRRARGVISTRVGYTGGEMPDPTYARHYGHAEAVEVTFDPSVLAYRSLLELFFQIHDPTTYEQQGSDVGPSYRSAIFYTTEVQKEVALATWRGQTLGALFLRHAGRGRVDRDRGLVVDPQHAAGIDGRTVAADEAARRGGAVAAGDLAQGEARDAGGGVVAHGGAEQAGRGAAQAAIAAEHEDLGGGLVHDREGIALAVAGGDDPAGQFDHRVGDVLAAGQFVQ